MKISWTWELGIPKNGKQSKAQTLKSLCFGNCAVACFSRFSLAHCVCVARFSLPVSPVSHCLSLSLTAVSVSVLPVSPRSRCLSLSLTVSVSVLPVFRCLPPFSDCSRHRALSYYSYYPTWTARILAPCYPVGCFTIRPF